jgi:ankyrin repeat protein
MTDSKSVIEIEIETETETVVRGDADVDVDVNKLISVIRSGDIHAFEEWRASLSHTRTCHRRSVRPAAGGAGGPGAALSVIDDDIVCSRTHLLQLLEHVYVFTIIAETGHTQMLQHILQLSLSDTHTDIPRHTDTHSVTHTDIPTDTDTHTDTDIPTHTDTHTDIDTDTHTDTDTDIDNHAILQTLNIDHNDCHAYGRSALSIACMYGYDKIVYELLQHHPNVNHRDLGGRTPLMYAAAATQCYHDNVIRSADSDLSSSTSPVTSTTTTSTTQSISIDSLQCVRYLLDAKADIHAIDAGGRPAISFAATNPRYDGGAIINVLLEAGCDIDVMKHDCQSMTSIDIAVRLGYSSNVYALANASPAAAYEVLSTAIRPDCNVLKHLLAQGSASMGTSIDVNAMNSDGCTVLMNAARLHHGGAELMIQLIEHKADIHARSDCGETAIYHAVSSENHANLQILLNEGAKVNIVDRMGVTPLHRACQVHHWAMVQTLLSHGANANAVTINGLTPLLIVCMKQKSGYANRSYGSHGSSLSIVRALMWDGADIEATDPHGRTALMFASYAGNTEVVEHLCEAHADVIRTDKYGESALHYALRGGSAHTVDRLFAHGAAATETKTMTQLTVDQVGVGNTPAIVLAARSPSFANLVHKMLVLGADPNATDSNGDSPLLLTVGRGSSAIPGCGTTSASVYTQSTAWNSYVANMSGSSASITTGAGSSLSLRRLHRMIRESTSEHALSLIQHGADITHANCHGITVLHLAVMDANYILGERLLEAGAEVNACDDNGCTPLWLISASLCSRLDDSSTGPGKVLNLFNLLVAYGANMNAVDQRSGMSVLGRRLSTIPAVNNMQYFHQRIDSYRIMCSMIQSLVRGSDSCGSADVFHVDHDGFSIEYLINRYLKPLQVAVATNNTMYDDNGMALYPCFNQTIKLLHRAMNIGRIAALFPSRHGRRRSIWPVHDNHALPCAVLHATDGYLFDWNIPVHCILPFL